MTSYTLTANQLFRLLVDVVDLAREYEDQHGYEADDARRAAVCEAIESLDVTDAEIQATLDSLTA